eukprot:11222537-Lingulodinium_polyedra.AAC.1
MPVSHWPGPESTLSSSTKLALSCLAPRAGPVVQWLIYTDGSSSEDRQGWGFVVLAKHVGGGVSLFSMAAGLAPSTPSNQGTSHHPTNNASELAGGFWALAYAKAVLEPLCPCFHFFYDNMLVGGAIGADTHYKANQQLAEL